MADYESLQQKFVELDLDGIPRDKIKEAKEAVGTFLVDAIISTVAEGKSPVTGEKFQKLTKDYADKEKGGDRTPNLELTSDMLNSVGFKSVKDGLAVGIMSAKERPKADGHNNFSGESSLPERRFIPGEDQGFKPDIEEAVNEILDEFRVETPSTTTRSVSAGQPLSITLSNILDNDKIVESILRKLNEQG